MLLGLWGSPFSIAAAAVAAWSALLAVVVARVMAAKVNRQAPEGERIGSVLRGGRDLRKRFKQIYPRSWVGTWLVLVLDVSVVVLMLSLIALVESLLFG